MRSGSSRGSDKNYWHRHWHIISRLLKKPWKDFFSSLLEDKRYNIFGLYDG